MATPVLYHIEVSHYNEKARWALDYKRIPHVRKAPPPMMHTVWAFAMTRGATFPVLKMNGDTIGDSTRIIEALERSHPDPALYPSGHAERARALELEEFFDEELAPHIRRALFAEVTRDREAFAWAAAPTAGRAVHAGFKGTAADGRAAAAHALRHQPPRAPRGAGRRPPPRWTASSPSSDGREYLVGDAFTVADLTAAALFFPLVRPDEAEYQVPDRCRRRWCSAARRSRHARASSGCRRCTVATAASPPKSRRSTLTHAGLFEVAMRLQVTTWRGRMA